MATVEQARWEIEEFIITAPGIPMDPDRAYGYQCKDVIDQFCEQVMGMPWTVGVGGANAKDVPNVAPADYWVWTPYVAGLTPPRGSFVIWCGNALNEFGHIALTMSATSTQITVMQQDGFTNTRPAHVLTLGYDNPYTGPIAGWLSVKPSAVKYTGADLRLNAPSTLLHGIDVSSYQSSINIGSVRSDFVIVKATEGVGYVNPHLHEHIAAAKSAGKRVGVYHFATALNDSDAEARHFLQHAQPHIDAGAVPVLDWEPIGLSAYTAWAEDFMRYVDEKTGRTAAVYMNLSVTREPSWTVFGKTHPLWLAYYGNDAGFNGYATTFQPPAVPGWKLAMWQYTQHGRLPGYSGELDLNVYFGGIAQWDGKLTTTSNTTSKDWLDMADEATVRKIMREEIERAETRKYAKLGGAAGDVSQRDEILNLAANFKAVRTLIEKLPAAVAEAVLNARIPLAGEGKVHGTHTTLGTRAAHEHDEHEKFARQTATAAAEQVIEQFVPALFDRIGELSALEKQLAAPLGSTAFEQTTEQVGK